MIKRAFSFPRFLLPAFLVLPLAACNMGGGGDSPAAVAVADVVITNAPQPVTVSTGQIAQFSVSAVDNKGRTLMYQWLRNGAVINGATGSSYGFIAGSGDDGAAFSVVVTDQNGCLQSLYNGHMDHDQKRCVLSGSASLTLGGGVTPVAGGIGGAGNLDGQGAAARFNAPASVAEDSHGNYYVADGYNQLIRKITPDGTVSTYAGKYNVAGHTDGNIADATFNLPIGVVVDSADNLYVADAFNSAVRKITPAGVVSTLAGGNGINGPHCVDGTGSGATLDIPQGIAIDAAGNLYVADSFCPAIRKITQAGVVTTLSSGISQQVFNVAVSPDGATIYYDVHNEIFRLDPATGVSTSLAGSSATGSADGTGAAAGFSMPVGMALDATGNLYVADGMNCTLRKITAAGVVTTLAGTPGCTTQTETDGTGAAATFLYPYGVLIDHTGNLVVGDVYGNTVRKVSLSGVTTTFAGLAANIGYVDGAAAAASFDFLRGSGLAADGSGNLYVADTQNQLIRKVAPNGTVTTLAGSPLQEGSADGVGSAARFNLPTDVAVDLSGNVYVADSYNDRIRKITPDGTVSTLAGSGSYGNADGTGTAASFGVPIGVAVDGAGNVYVAEYGNNTIRKITPAGVVTTFAGQSGVAGSADGTGTAATFNQPAHLVLDTAGNLYVTDTGNSTIRKITPTGVVSTVAGTAGQYGSADGTGSAARFDFRILFTIGLVAPGAGISIDGAGNLYVADTNNGTIRKITPAGVVSTVAGVAGQIGIQLGALPSTLGPTQGVAVVGNTLYTTVESASLLSFPLP